VIAHYGLTIHSVQPDEVIPIAGSRHVLEDPAAALGSGSNLSGRGLERTLAVVFAFVQWVLGSTATAFKAQHVISAGSFAAAVLVVWAWGRRLGLAPWQAAVAGGLSACVPWLVLGTSFLNSAPAYSLTTLALYAMWRATVEPGLWRDVVALTALLALGLTRVGNIPIAAAFPVGILVYALHDRMPGVGVGQALRGLPARAWREHPLLVALGALGLLAIAVAGTHWLVGGYPVRAAHTDNARALLRFMLATIAMGTGVVPVVFALAWAARSLVRPTRPEFAAFAALGTGAFVALAYVAATQGAEERYLAPLAPMMLLAFVVALARRETPVLLVVVAGLVVARAIAITGPGLEIGPYAFFAQPAQSFFRRIVLGKTSLALPFTNHHVLTTVVLVAVLVAVIATVAARARPALVLGLVAVAVGAYGAAGGLYAMKKFSTQAGYPTLRFEDQSWIDGRIGPGSKAALVGGGLAGEQMELAVFNRSLGSPYRPRVFDPATADPDTGALPAQTPSWLVLPDGLQLQGVDGDVVASTSYLPVRALLLRVRQPARLSYWVLSAGNPFKIRAYGAGCLRITFQATPGRRAWSVGSIGERVRGTTDGTRPVTVQRQVTGTMEDFGLLVQGGATVLSVTRQCSA
jgi:hypothetical protein